MTLLTGTTLAQAIPLLVAPVLSRLYVPEDFGALALFTSIVFTVGSIAGMRYEIAIVLPEEEQDARGLARIALMSSAVIAALMAIVILFFRHFLNEAHPQFPVWFWSALCGGSVFLYSFFNISLNRELRYKQFKQISFAKVSRTFTTALISVVLAFTFFKTFGLIIGVAAGFLIADIFLFSRGRGYFREKKPSPASSRQLMQTYKDFRNINTPHVLLDNFKEHGIVFVLAAFFISPVVGLYSLAFRILKAPVGLIGNSIHQVFYQRATELTREDKPIHHLVKKLYLNLFFVGLPVFGLLFFFAPALFAFIFGENWREAGTIAGILSPWLLINFIASPVASVALILKKQQFAMLFSLVDILVRLMALLIGGYANDYVLGFQIMAGLSGAVQLISLLWYYQLAKTAAIKN